MLRGVIVGVWDQLDGHGLITGAGRGMYPRRLAPLIAPLGRGRQIDLRNDEAVYGRILHNQQYVVAPRDYRSR